MNGLGPTMAEGADPWFGSAPHRRSPVGSGQETACQSQKLNSALGDSGMSETPVTFVLFQAVTPGMLEDDSPESVIDQLLLDDRQLLDVLIFVRQSGSGDLVEGGIDDLARVLAVVVRARGDVVRLATSAMPVEVLFQPNSEAS